MELSGNGKAKVIVAGHSCLDITPVFPQGTGGISRDVILSPGKLIEMAGVEISAGGAVSNTGIAMKLLGADVTLLTKTGEDEFGSILKDIYGRYGVRDSVLSVMGERTSYSVVIAPPGIDRIFLHDPGCNHSFCLEDVKKADFSDIKLFHFGYPPLMRNMYRNDGLELAKMMEYVKSQGVVTSLDMAAVDPASEAGEADWDKILKSTLPYVDIFVPSVEELCFMLDRTRLEEWNERSGGKDPVQLLTYEDIVPLAQTCMEYGVKVLLIKCGAPGLLYYIADDIDDLAKKLGIIVGDWRGRKGFECSYVPDRVLSAAGAGDTTIAAFLVAMLSGYPLDMCMHLAVAEGASCVEAYGALGGIRKLEELESKIGSGWKKFEGRMV